MSGTGLLIAEIVFLVLLYGLVVAVARSAARDLSRGSSARAEGPLRDAAEPAPPAPPHVLPTAGPRIAPPDLPHLADPVGAWMRDTPAPVAQPAAPTAEDPDRTGAWDALLAEPSAVPEPAGPQAEPLTDPPEQELTASRRRPSVPQMDLLTGLRPRLVVEDSPSLAAGVELPLDEGLTIGRSRSSQLAVSDSFISHMHARIFRRGQFFFVEDLGSTNGTFVNQRRITGPTQLKMHDELRMGETVLRYLE